tara:strand:+ start:249 stop:803 length:555 start_codon:yes stop_codon:yes gene_type:complete
MTIYEKLVDIQGRLKAPKNQRNNFGRYNYRSCEDILEAVKPLLTKHKLALTITDEIIEMEVLKIAYVQAIATLKDGDHEVFVCAQAGIDFNRKGMDISQSFGSSSSYARKYALNGLFLIDDTKDADATNTHDKTMPKTLDAMPELKKGTEAFNKVKEALSKGFTMEEVKTKYKVNSTVEKLLTQ